MRRSLHACAVVLLVGAFTSACAEGQTTSEGSGQNAEATTLGAEFLSQTKAASAAASYVPQPFVTVEDLLPNHLYEAKEANVDAQPVVDAVVVGKVIDVSQGYGFPVSVPDDGKDQTMDFAAPNAAWSTATLDVAVDEEIATADGEPLPESIRVGVRVLPVGGSDGNWKYDFETFKKSLVTSGQTIFFLEQGPAAYSYDPELFGLFMGGEWWCSLNGDQLVLPAVSDEVAEKRLKEADTLSELRTAATQPETVTQVSKLESVWLSGSSPTGP